MRFMSPFQVEGMKSSARCSLASMEQISRWTAVEGVAQGGRTVAADSQYLSSEGDATGDWWYCGELLALTGDFTNYDSAQPRNSVHEVSSATRATAAALDALIAMARRSSGVSFSALALPPW